MADLPRYDDLPVLDELGLRHAWGVFGEDDRLGTVNLLTPDRVAAAAAGVRRGEVAPNIGAYHCPNPMDYVIQGGTLGGWDRKKAGFASASFELPNSFVRCGSSSLIIA